MLTRRRHIAGRALYAVEILLSMMAAVESDAERLVRFRELCRLRMDKTPDVLLSCLPADHRIVHSTEV